VDRRAEGGSVSADSKIEWCHHSFNPWWGCVKVSPACKNCYAEAFAKRVGQRVWGPPATTPRRFFGDKHWQEPLKWNRAAEKAGERHRVFCASMADVFEDAGDVVDGERARLWNLIEATPSLDWLLLTKRPENAHRMVPSSWLSGRAPANAWLGTTAEDQEHARARLPHVLSAVWPVVRFVSYEPALAAVDLTAWLGYSESWDRAIGPCGCEAKRDPWTRCDACVARGWHPIECDGLQWVIVGGESGAGARPFDIEWARSVVAQCRAANVACFVKQLGAYPVAPVSDPEASNYGERLPLRLRDRKGGDMAEWWDFLRVREFPSERSC
jgi:protein gp37